MASPVPQADDQIRRSIPRGERSRPKATRQQPLRWHYRRGERDEADCFAYRVGREYHLRIVTSDGTAEVHRCASAETLLDRHAVIERRLTAAGWDFVRLTHHADARHYEIGRPERFP
jgi:hypothetical protein